MKIQFFDKETFKVIPNSEFTYKSYFVMDNVVYRDNGYVCESQSQRVGFWDFIEVAPEIGWRVVND